DEFHARGDRSGAAWAPRRPDPRQSRFHAPIDCAMRRRDFLEAAGMALFPIGPEAWAATVDGGSPKRLIVILLRGAVDGLNGVVPYAEDAYYRERPSIAIAQPGKANGALALDGQFGLHPALASLMPLWTERSLAFIHAAGSPDPTRSHFDAQLYLE